MAGAGGDHEGTAIELVAASAIESVANATTEEAAASSEISANGGAESQKEQAPLTAADTAPHTQAETSAAEPNAVDGNTAAANESKPKIEPQREQIKGEDNHGEQNVRRKPQDALASGGTNSRGTSTNSTASRASAAASAGDVSRYAAAVRAVLMRGRPRYIGLVGSVSVEFKLTLAGEVSRAEVHTSSGNARLDQAALNAIHRMRFPAPPAGMREGQLSYLATFDFR